MCKYQATISQPASCYGIGAHSGKKVQIIMRPASAGTGIVFIRTDVQNCDNVVKVHYKNVNDTYLNTSIQNKAKVTVSTIEHLMAAIYGCQIDNLIIEIDGPEVPIMDGSSLPFMFAIEGSGKSYLNAKRKYLKINKEIHVQDHGSSITAIPSDNFEIDSSISFDSKVIGTQSIKFSSSESFKEKISSARTFGFKKHLNVLNRRGLALGVSLENVIGIDEDDELMNELRFKDEFVRHKVLDSLGDFFITGNIIGKILCNKASHQLNNMFLHKLLENSANYSIIY